MSTTIHNDVHSDSGPKCQDWLVPQKSTNPSDNRDHKLDIPPGLKLSTRRGPEAELYDLAGVHLLSSAVTASCDPASYASSGGLRKWGSRLTSLLSTRNPASQKNKCKVPVVLANKTANTNCMDLTEFSLGRLPTKLKQTSNDCITSSAHHPGTPYCGYLTMLPHPSTTEKSLPPVCPYTSCFGIGSHHHLLRYLSIEQWSYYKNGFSLAHRRTDANSFILLLSIVAVSQLVLMLATTSPVRFLDRYSSGRDLTLFTFGEYIRLVLLCASVILASLGLLCANWDKLTSAKSTVQELSESESFIHQTQAEVGRIVANLLTVQQFRRRLTCAHVLGFASCFMLSTCILPWLPICELLASSVPFHGVLFSCSGVPTKDYYSISTLTPDPLSASISLILPTGQSLYIGISDSADTRWIVFWLVILVHGLFNVDGLWPRWWQYVLTISLCVTHMILTNVLYALLGYVRGPISTIPDTNVTLPCTPELHHAQLLSPVPLWDNDWSLLCRTNLFSAIAFLVAYLIGQSIANWTSLHRCRLFLTTGAAEAKLNRLALVEKELDQLTHSLVPAPLADDLGRDFISGYLGWSSPLVIYLRNVSFLSAEFIGLSSLASLISSSPAMSLQAATQFVAFVNDLSNCFDRMAEREGCYRVRLNSSEYLYIAGYPETRVDHARSCVDFGLSMLAVINELSEMSGVKLELRIAVHTGTAYAAVLGRTRLGFELTGDDVLYVNTLRQAAVRPGRVLTSRPTFNQLPEGFRGEAGPVISYPYPINVTAQVIEQFPHCSLFSMDTYFVQPRQPRPSSTSVEVDTSVLDNTNSHPEWPKLDELSVDNLHLVNRVAATASIVCRRSVEFQPHPVQSLIAAAEVPFDYFSTSTSTREEAFDKLADVRLDLLHSLSISRYNDAESTASVRVSRDPGLHNRIPDPVMAEPPTALPPFEKELDTSVGRCTDTKLAPCLRRAGKLRGKSSVDEADLMNRLNDRSTAGADNSMGTSLTTTTTTATAALLTNPDAGYTSLGHTKVERMWKPLLNQLPWLYTSPPGCESPHWLTLGAKPMWVTFRDRLFSSKKVYSHLADSISSSQHVDVPSQSSRHSATPVTNDIAPAAFRSDPIQRLRVMRFAILTSLPLVMALAVLNTLLVSRSFMFLLSHLVSLLYLMSQFIALCLLERCPHLKFLIRPTFNRIFLSSSAVVSAAAVAVTWSACQPSLLVNAASPHNNTSLSFVLQSALSTRESGQLCPFPFEFVLLAGLSHMVPAVLFQTAMFTTFSTVESGLDTGLTGYHQLSHAPVLFSQFLRFCFGCGLLLLHITAFIWTAVNSKMFRRSQLRNTGESRFTTETGLAAVASAQTLLCLVAFSTLSFLLPRNLEYQLYLLHQWVAKGHEATNRLSAVRSALVHLLLSVVPRFALTAVYSPKKTPELYSSAHPFVGFVLIQLAVTTDRARSSPDRTARTNEPTSTGCHSDTEEPSQVADRLRLLNHLIGMIDGLADSEALERRPLSDPSDAVDSRNDGQANLTALLRSDLNLVKVHVGGTAIGYAVGLSPTTTHSQSTQMNDLLSFTERALEACEEVNTKARSTNTFIYARIALHTGPAVVGLVGKRRPVFTLWGTPVHVCLHLLQQSHVPALNRQHLLLATDAVIRMLPPSRLNSSFLAGKPLIWRCVNTQSGRILLSSQLSTNEVPCTSIGSVPKSPPCPILHFCSIPATYTIEPDTEYMNKAAFAVLNLAKTTSLRAPHTATFQPHNYPLCSSNHMTPAENNSKGFGARQSVHVSQPPTSSVSTLQHVVQHPPSMPVLPSTTPNNHVTGHFTTAQSQVQQCNGTHPLHPIPTVVVPPPPPPHQRAYSSQGLQTSREPDVSTAHTWIPSGSVDGPSEPQVVYGPLASLSLSDGLCDILTCQPGRRTTQVGHNRSTESPNAVSRQAIRRGVVSQCAPRCHEYSIVHVEPLPPSSARVHSTELQRRCVQPLDPCAKDGLNSRWHGPKPLSPNHKTPLETRADSHNPTQCLKQPAVLIPTSVTTQLEDFSHSVSQQPNQPGIPRSLTMSSTDSFLAAEMACAREFDHPKSSESPAIMADESSEDDADENVNGNEVISHHNPLYTDNEYESMAESQGNLCPVGHLRSGIAHIRAGSGHSTGDKQHSGDKLSLLPKRNDVDLRDRYVIQSAVTSNHGRSGHPFGRVHSSPHMQSRSKELSFQAQRNCVKTVSGPQGGQLYSPVSGYTDFSADHLNFPNIRRPRSPNCARDQDMATRANIPLHLPDAPVGYGTGNYAEVESRDRFGHSSSSASSTTRCVPLSNLSSGNRIRPLPSSAVLTSRPSDMASVEPIASISLTHPISGQSVTPKKYSSTLGPVKHELPQSVPKTTLCLASDVDTVEAEYAGTYSLGPLSMVVQPSIAGDGLTSCDEDYAEDDRPNFTSPLGSSGYPDQVLVNRFADTKESIPSTSSSGLFGFQLSGGRAAHCMTDSLLANPDLDAPSASDASDFSEPSEPGSPHAPLHLHTPNSHLPDLHPIPSLFTGGSYANQSSEPRVDIELNESETDEVFAYHGHPVAFNSQSAASQVPQVLYEGSQASYSQPPGQPLNRDASTSRVLPKGHWFPSMPEQHFVSGHSVVLQRPQPPRSSLPAIAPVGMPDFHRLQKPLSSNAFLTPSELNGTSEYDNLCPNSSLFNNKSLQIHPQVTETRVSGPIPNGVSTNAYFSTSPEHKEMNTVNGFADNVSSIDGSDSNRKPPHEVTNSSGQQLPESVDHLTNGKIVHRSDGPKDAEPPKRLSVPPTKLPVPIDPKKSTRFTAVSLQRTPSSAGSHTSSTDQQGSEYDNVDRSQSLLCAADSVTLEVTRCATATMETNQHKPRIAYSSRRSGSLGGRPGRSFANRGDRSVWDAEIAAEARRISRQFRAMGWLPASSCVPPSDGVSAIGRRGDFADIDMPCDAKFDGASLQPAFAREFPLPRLFFLPTGTQASTPCSRHTSLRYRNRRGPSAPDSETVTTVTSQFDEDRNYFDDSTDASDFECDEHKGADHANGSHRFGSLPDRQLGCVMIRPRSLSATCLNMSFKFGEHNASNDHILLTDSSSAGNSSGSESDNGVESFKKTDLGDISSVESSHSPNLYNSTSQPNARLRSTQHCAVRRTKSTRPTRSSDRVKRDNGSPGFSRLQRRAARVRSLIPLELQPYILPGCMSSLSRSSSVASHSSRSETGDFVFLSLAHRDSTFGSPISRNHMAVHRSKRPTRSASDPELCARLMSTLWIRECPSERAKFADLTTLN